MDGPHNWPSNDTAFRKLKEVHQKTASHAYGFVYLAGRFEGKPITDVQNAFNAAIARRAAT